MAARTLEPFVARALRLYEQEPGEADASPGLDHTCGGGSGGPRRGWPWRTSQCGTAPLPV